jgi:hypothetical protein
MEEWKEGGLRVLSRLPAREKLGKIDLRRSWLKVKSGEGPSVFE